MALLEVDQSGFVRVEDPVGAGSAEASRTQVVVWVLVAKLPPQAVNVAWDSTPGSMCSAAPTRTSGGVVMPHATSAWSTSGHSTAESWSARTIRSSVSRRPRPR
ncbi:hypothetical protein EIL87_01950 [Saccharopolyspora rhizosphaerae]|uniref:Uncharacterized protein n=1 Tax=Saccharopolyspora rhizosphaerae TaxID=2492662 RepID=A0A426K5J7_9PSEU|nr:hypothetical protein [Saccharopolyspora rhizosphaerae]RRO20654.1 hypothetical protein EIL87_01950 [Saccharopolyspora rhizosphaerae]